MYRKLSADEISAVVAKIRKKYDDYCRMYFKPRRVKEEFENRYINALRQNIDISNFLLAEISAVEELHKIEERKIEAAPSRAPVTAEKKENFADKIIEENRKRIEKYPVVSIHKDSNPEVNSLLGALNELYEKHFPRLHTILRTITTHQVVRDLTSLENSLRQLGYLGKEPVSARLTRYLVMLERFPRDYRAIEREEKEYILESSFLLHDIIDTLDLIQAQYSERNKKNNEFDEIYTFIQGILDDFRLKDLKRRK